MEKTIELSASEVNTILATLSELPYKQRATIEFIYNFFQGKFAAVPEPILETPKVEEPDLDIAAGEEPVCLNESAAAD